MCERQTDDVRKTKKERKKRKIFYYFLEQWRIPKINKCLIQWKQEKWVLSFSGVFSLWEAEMAEKIDFLKKLKKSASRSAREQTQKGEER